MIGQANSPVAIPPAYEPARDLLRDRVVLITGATGGLGAAISRACSLHGASVVLLARRERVLNKLYDELDPGSDSTGTIEKAPRGNAPVICPMDLAAASPNDFESLRDSLNQEFGRLDAIVHAAALLGNLTSVEQQEPLEWARVMQVNLHAPWLLTRALLPLLRQSRDASVVFMSDAVGRKGRAYWGAYGVSKFGVEGLVQILADELERNTRIRVNAFNPGPSRTTLRSSAYPAEDPATLAKPAAAAPSVLYLLGPDSHGISGQSLGSPSEAG